MKQLSTLLIIGTALIVVAFFAFRKTDAKTPAATSMRSKGDGSISPKTTGLTATQPNDKGSKPASSRPVPPEVAPPQAAKSTVDRAGHTPSSQEIMARGAVEAKYSRLFVTMKAPEEKVELLKGILVQRQQTLDDVIRAAKEQGLDPTKPDGAAAINSLAKTVIGDYFEKIRQEAGADTLAALQQYDKRMPERTTVDLVLKRIEGPGVTFDVVARERLVELISDPDKRVIFNVGGSMVVLLSDAAITRAGAVLTPGQLETFRRFQQEQATQRAASKARAPQKQ